MLRLGISRVRTSVFAFIACTAIAACGASTRSRSVARGDSGPDASPSSNGGRGGGGGGTGARGGSGGSGAGGVTGSGGLRDASAPDGGSVVPDASDGGLGCGVFVGLGDLAGGALSSTALALSRDGTTVVGRSSSSNGLEAMRWQAATGMVGLGGLTGGTFESVAYGVSADGSVVVGTSHSGLVDCPGRSDEAFRWTEASGIVALGDLATGCFFSYAYGVSADGSLVVGGATNALSNTGSTWSQSSSWTDLDFASIDQNSSAINAVTPDKSVLVGNDRIDATAEYQVFRWTAAGGQELLGDLPGGVMFANAAGLTDAGDLIVGYGTTALGEEAFRWTSAGGMATIGDFPGGPTLSHANAVSPEGTLIVGFGSDATNSVAAIWEGPQSITAMSDFLTLHGVLVPPGWKLWNATGVAVNGRVVTFAGDATNPEGGAEAWIASYCR